MHFQKGYLAKKLSTLFILFLSTLLLKNTYITQFNPALSANTIFTIYTYKTS